MREAQPEVMGMTRCICLATTCSGKLHSHDCPKWKTYARRREQRKYPATSERVQARKAGKHGRIKDILKELRPQQKPVGDEQLSMLLGMKEQTSLR
jgi:hypothetical protein